MPTPRETLWEAVVARDRRFDGSFVYAVTSTGIYCRPTCPSRRPRPERARFFDTPGAAREAGFRACKRCEPDAVACSHPALQRAIAACRLIEASDEGVPTLRELADAVGGSPEHLQRTFKRLVGVSPRAYAETLRDERFRARLRGGASIAAATFAAGFGSASRVYERSGARLGMTPGRYREHGAGRKIRYAVTACSLGQLLVAATDIGVCRIALGERSAALVVGLRREFARARVEADRSALEPILDALVRALDGAPLPTGLPLDIRGTAFQRRVWDALREIPLGSTATYAEIARAIDLPSAARAVANACGANPLPVLIPCHRVVRSDGSTGGYRFGAARKAALLAAEAGRIPKKVNKNS